MVSWEVWCRKQLIESLQLAVSEFHRRDWLKWEKPQSVWSVLRLRIEPHTPPHINEAVWLRSSDFHVFPVVSYTFRAQETEQTFKQKL
jgi:hypothetical protein